MDEFQIRAKSQKKVESIADMRNFVETYPQFKVSINHIDGIFYQVERTPIFTSQFNLNRKCPAQ